jgi:hypothetical protein
MKILKLLFAIVMLSVFIGAGSCEFEDTVQNHWDMNGGGFGDKADLTNLWVPISPYHTTGGAQVTDITIVQKGLPYSQSIRGYLKAHDYLDSISYLLYTQRASESNYWSFTVRDFTRTDDCSAGYYEYGYIKLRFYDIDGFLVGEYTMATDNGTSNIVTGPFGNNHDDDAYEIFITGGNAYLQVNGTNFGVLGVCTRTPAYMGFYSWGRGSRPGGPPSCSLYYTMWIDDITTEDGIVGIGAEPCLTGTFAPHTVTELDNNELDVSWHARTIPKSSYDAAQYTLQVKRLINGTTINTTVLKVAGDTTTKPAGFVEYNWSTMFGAESYGAYNFNLYKDTTLIGQDYIIYKSLLDDSWINIEKDQYGIGDTMKVTYFLDTPDFTPNDYYIKLYDASGEVKESRGIFASSGTEYFETLGYASGMTYSLLVKDTEPATDYEDGRDLVELAFDVTNMLDSVFIHGITYNAETGVPLPNVSINFTQEDSQYNTTSDSNGTYEFTYQTGSGTILTNETVEFVTDVLIEANASKPLWWHENFSFTPLVAGTLILDLYLLPDCANLTHDNYTIAGMTLSYPFHQAVGVATTNIKNATTYTNTTISSADMGYYRFDELPVTTGGMYVGIVNETFNSSVYDTWVSLSHSIIQVGSQKVTNTTDEIAFYNNTDYLMNYTDGKIKINSSGNMTNHTDYHIDYNYFSSGIPFYVNATKTGYKDSDTYTVSIVDECEYQNIILHGLYNLTIWAKHAQTHISLTDFDAILNEADQKSSGSNTSLTFTQVEYGIWKVQVDKEGFYSDVKYVYVAQDTNTTFYLAPIIESGGEGVGQYYAPPHLVEFRIENIWGRPYENVHINITAQETTMGAWDWLASVFGFRDEIAAEIQNGTMNGTTDTYGAMSFMMTETIKYKVHAYNATQGIDKIVYVYPKEERYIIVCSVIRWEQNGTEEMRELTINVTTSTINDTHANITVEYYDPSNATTDLTFYINRTTNYNDQELVASYNVLDDSNETYSFTVTPISGRSFFVRVATVNDEWGSKVWDFAVKFPGLLIDLGLPSIAYPMMAIALILFTGGLFGASSATQGSLICCLEGWLFLGMGWFATVASSVTITMALSLATIISILAIVIEKGRRTGVQ